MAEAIISDLCSASIVRLKTRAIGAVSSDVVAESRDAESKLPMRVPRLLNPIGCMHPCHQVGSLEKVEMALKVQKDIRPEMRKVLRVKYDVPVGGRAVNREI